MSSHPLFITHSGMKFFKFVNIIIFASAVMLPLRAAPLNRIEAEKLCDNLPLSDIEGIWEFPSEETSMLIKRSDDRLKGVFDIILIESTDCRLFSGMKLGEIMASADPYKFKLHLSSKIKKGVLKAPMDCLATLSKTGKSITIEEPGIKISFSPSIIFPSLWNFFRLGARMRFNNPASKIPQGWIKTYPSPDSSPNYPYSPIYF